jgi:hypothetical protein
VIEDADAEEQTEERREGAQPGEQDEPLGRAHARTRMHVEHEERRGDERRGEHRERRRTARVGPWTRGQELVDAQIDVEDVLGQRREAQGEGAGRQRDRGGLVRRSRGFVSAKRAGDAEQDEAERRVHHDRRFPRYDRDERRRVREDAGEHRDAEERGREAEQSPDARYARSIHLRST